ncbi:serine/arginine repetitive matrix protein 2 [Streptomyces sp. CA-250714]|uniref:serine/arginine repetitive matrix protein 2 n=1 Tax=Streptomyces sp. CA-250714 TaxID=3240060 RepID=UPI003D8E6163
MTIGTHGATPYGGPPPPSMIPAKDVRPRRIWYLVAALLALALAGSGAAVLVVTVKDAVSSVDTARSFPGGGSQTFSLTEGETKAIFVSQSGKGQVNCRIPEMRSGSMTRPDSTFRVTAGSRTWERVFEVKPGSSGDYSLTCTSERQAQFAMGDKPRVGATVGVTFAAFALFFAALAAAVTISAVTAIRRSSHRRQLAAALAPSPQWGQPAFGPPPGPPPGPLA